MNRSDLQNIRPAAPGVLIRLISWGLVALLGAACASRPPERPTPRPTTPTVEPAPRPKPYRVGRQWYQPLADARGFKQQGQASWYGRKFHGRRTASGEIYDMHAESAAHKTLPLGTYVRVRNLGNNRQIDVRINDRGPFVRGRIIDLSYAAAKKLKMVGPGTAAVEVTALGRLAGDGGTYAPVDYYHGNFTFQVGAFKDRRNAERLLARLDAVYRNAHITQYRNGGETFYRVRVGRSASLEQAQNYEKMLIDNGFPDTFIIAE